MQTIEAKVQIGDDRTLRVKLPADVPVGEYEVVLVLNQSKNEQSDPKMTAVWEKWVEEVEQLPLLPNPIQGDYQQHLIDKYRQQDLKL